MPTTAAACTPAPTLARDGLCVLPGVVEPALVRTLEERSLAWAARQTPEEAARQRYTGSLIGLELEPLFARLIGHRGVRAALASLGWRAPRYMNGYIISKPPGSPALYWHQDWWGWDHPLSYQDAPPMVFAMCYLTDTSPANGCLRALPGTHRRRHALHDALPDAHTPASDTALGEGIAQARVPGEIEVPVRAGDLVIGDARVLHATHANRSDAPRTVITMWYIPQYEVLPDALRREIARQARTNPHSGQPHPPWPADAEALVADLRPEHPGPLAPYSWVQRPDRRLEAAP